MYRFFYTSNLVIFNLHKISLCILIYKLGQSGILCQRVGEIVAFYEKLWEIVQNGEPVLPLGSLEK